MRRYGAVAAREPSNLAFAGQGDVAPGAVVSTAQLSLAGIRGRTPVAVAGGEYRILNPDNSVWQDWTGANGVCHPFQKLQLRVTAALTDATTSQVTVTVGTTVATWSVSTASATPGHEQETEAFLAKLAALESGSMTASQTAALDAFYLAAKASTWWTKTHRLYVRLHDEAASSIDLRDQLTTLTQVGASGSVTWTPAGWATGGNSGRGLDMHVNPATATAPGSVALVLWYPDVTTTGGSDNSFDLQGSDISVRMRQNAAGNLQCRLHAAGNQTLTGVTAAPGLRVASRTGPAATAFYGPAGTSIGTSGTRPPRRPRPRSTCSRRSPAPPPPAPLWWPASATACPAPRSPAWDLPWTPC